MCNFNDYAYLCHSLPNTSDFLLLPEHLYHELTDKGMFIIQTILIHEGTPPGRINSLVTSLNLLDYSHLLYLQTCQEALGSHWSQK